MMTTRRKRIVERLEGAGPVYQAESPIAKARYSLIVSQDVLTVQTFGGTSEMEGKPSGVGDLVITECASWLTAATTPLTLELEDGTRVPFQVIGQQVVADQGDKYRIRILG